MHHFANYFLYIINPFLKIEKSNSKYFIVQFKIRREGNWNGGSRWRAPRLTKNGWGDDGKVVSVRLEPIPEIIARRWR